MGQIDAAKIGDTVAIRTVASEYSGLPSYYSGPVVSISDDAVEIIHYGKNVKFKTSIIDKMVVGGWESSDEIPSNDLFLNMRPRLDTSHE